MKNLVIVESPAKAKTIERFLGSEFVVKSSFGHIRDLSKQNLGVDVARDFAPDYVVSPGKEKVVAELRRAVSAADVVWLASDEDREGEAIAWHLAETLSLTPSSTRRIVFHEITKRAILEAIENPRGIDTNLVDAQQARRVLDRLVGFEVSPILWRKVKPSLSAGRVQSVAVRLLVEREREIIAFEPDRYYRVQAQFRGTSLFKAELSERLSAEQEARAFAEKCVECEFTVASIEDKPLSRAPAPPFTTSTLQQEASRKLSFSTSKTMSVAQRLYESGMITYMRTDSVNLSGQAIADLGAVIESEYGSEYHKVRNYRTKSKGAQEAHEAIRPTSAQRVEVALGRDEQRLYDLIRKRALASQMADAKLLRTTVRIEGAGLSHHFVAQGEVVEFDGFLRLYLEGSDEEESEEKSGRLPRLAVGERVSLETLLAQERFTQHQPRYTEAALVKRLEELGIGRPSTYAPTITTIVERGYVLRDNREGARREVWQIEFKGGKLCEAHVGETYGAERRKLFPSDIGMVVTDFLVDHFPALMDYNFTASVEEQLDQIAAGDKEWQAVLHEFYGPFHARVEEVMEVGTYAVSERELGVDPKSGEPVIVRLGRFGPLAQIGRVEEGGQKPRYASLRRDQLIETITLDEALRLFDLPRHIGEFEGEELVIGIGRFGPYVRHGGNFVSLEKEDDPYTVDAPRAVELIEARRKRDAERTLRVFSEDESMRVLRGRWGAYLSYEKKSYRLPKEFDWEAATYADMLKIVEQQKSEAKGAKRATAKGGKKAGSDASGTKKSVSKKGTSKGGKPRKS